MSEAEVSRTFVVVPFERVGLQIGPRQALVVDAAGKARALAQALSATVPGVGVIERQVDAKTGDIRDELLAGFGIVPPRFPLDSDWTVLLS
jgi:hypothetical protein